MCIHPKVTDEGDRETVDTLCRSMTASWVRSKVKEGGGNGAPEYPLCSFYENYDKDGTNAEIPSGVYSLHDLKELGKSKGWCPYFMTRRILHYANIIVYNYQYMLDPKVASLISKDLETESIVVFDEAHNIDNVCIEALSVTLDRRLMDASLRSVNRLQQKVGELKASDSARLAREYSDLVRGLQLQGLFSAASNTASGSAATSAVAPSSSSSSSEPRNSSSETPLSSPTAVLTDTIFANPVLNSDILQEAVPGNIRKAEHFVVFLKKVVMYLRDYLKQGVEKHIRTCRFLSLLRPTKLLYHSRPRCGTENTVSISSRLNVKYSVGKEASSFYLHSIKFTVTNFGSNIIGRVQLTPRGL